MRPIPDRCEWPASRSKAGGSFVACGKSVLFRCPDGEVRHVVMWSTSQQRYVGPCCVGRSRLLHEQFMARYEDFPKGYEPYEQTEAEQKAEKALQQRLRFALSETRPYHSGGLMRQDGSAAYDVDFVPVPNLRRIG